MPEKKTLLEKARAVKTRVSPEPHVSDELVELVMSWGRGELTIGQVSTALESPVHRVYPRLAKTFRHLIREGCLETSGWLEDREESK